MANSAKIENFKLKPKGVREFMRSKEMQGALINAALGVARSLNSNSLGALFTVGPVGEPVTSAIGAHAFVRTENRIAAEWNFQDDVLNRAVGG